MVQAVIHWLVIEEALRRAQGNFCGTDVRKLTLGHDVVEIFQLLLP